MTKGHSQQLTSPLAVGAALAVGLLVVGCSGRKAEVPVEQTIPLVVTTARATLADVADTFEAGGVVRASTTATMTARILAPVLEVRVAPGDRVRAGQTLVVLDGRDLAAQTRSARSAVLAAEQTATALAAEQQAADAGLTLARATHERIAGLHAKRSATAQELDDAAGALRAADAREAGASARAQAARSSIDSARAAGEAAGTTESFALIAAPFNGVVTEKMVEPGNMAAPGTPLVRVEDTRGFRLDVNADESRVGQMAPGAIVSIALDAGAGNASRVVSGTVTEIGRAVDADARAFLVKISLPADGGLRSGMFGRARFSTQPRRVLTVPPGALVRQGQVTSVFVVEEGIARVRLVHANGTEVLAGLTDGEVVIVSPPAALRDGRHVKVGDGR